MNNSEFITNLKTSFLKKVWRFICKEGFKFLMAFVLTGFIWYTASTLNYIKKIAILIAEQNIEMYTVQTLQYVIIDKAILAINENTKILAESTQEAITTLSTTTQEAIDKVNLANKQREEKIDATLARMAQKPDYEYLKSITVIIREKSTLPNDKTAWMGTGILIKVTHDETIIISNQHVCDFAPNTMCYVDDVENSVEYPLTSVKRNHFDQDIQIMKITGHIQNKQAVKGLATVKPQDQIFVCGNNNGNYYQYSQGWVSGRDKYTNDLIVQTASTHGNSGSPVVDVNGFLVGVVYAGQMIHDWPGTISDTSKAYCIAPKC